ncbi:MAG: bifunctional 4-hydroxy-2-oxoglutarate aldolase/2-dehydro-3-deoxy-phosphogluconate aldolase [Leptolinea sp.]
MEKPKTLELLKAAGLIAVIRGPSQDLTLKMVDALVKGGVKGIEITYSTPNANEVVMALEKTFGNQIILGMGTLTRVEQVDEAKDAGAIFLVSPMCEPTLCKAMAASGLACMMGAVTPTEVFQAYTLGSDVVKLFPGSLVGPSYVKALKGPFPHIPLMPTGGVSVSNVGDWFKAGVFGVGAGSELCPPNLAKDGRFDEIIQIAEQFVKAVEVAKAAAK